MPYSETQKQQFIAATNADHVLAVVNGVQQYTVHWDLPVSLTTSINCIGYACGLNEKIIAATRQEMVDQLASRGYFEVAATEPVLKNDLELYVRGTQPAHAHKIVNPGGGNTECESKMGEGPVITHSRAMLNSPRTAGGNVYKWGQIVGRYRFNATRHAAWKAENFEATASGRYRKKNPLKTRSGRVNPDLPYPRTRSGRIAKPSQKEIDRVKEEEAKKKAAEGKKPAAGKPAPAPAKPTPSKAALAPAKPATSKPTAAPTKPAAAPAKKVVPTKK